MRKAWYAFGWALLAGLTALTLTGATQAVDAATLNWFTPLDQPGAVHAIWRTLVMGGQFWLVGSAVLLVAAVRSWRSRRKRPFLVSFAAVAALDVLILSSKQLVGRTSPNSGLNEVLAGGTSYPSGHTANATMCLVLLAVLLTRRRPALLAAIGFAIVVGLCNVVLGYHWPSEVVAGWLLGALIVVAAARQLPSSPRTKSAPWERIPLSK